MMRRPSCQAAPLALVVLALHLSACAAQTPSSAPAPAGASARAQGGQGGHGDTAAQHAAADPAPSAAAAAPAPSAAPSSAAAPASNPVHAPNARVGVSSAAGAPDVAAPNPAGAGPDAAAPAAPAAAPTAPAVVAPVAPAPGAPVVMPSGSPTGSLLQTLFAMILVLAALGALAWFLKRYGPKASGANANVKIVGSLNLGGRERLLVVEVGNQWIVVGASPGRVNGLATMPKQEGVDATATLSAPAPAAANFGDWLRQTLDKRKE